MHTLPILSTGQFYPLELHIVHKVVDTTACAKGCYTVTGIMFKIDPEEKDNEILAPIFDNMPLRTGSIVRDELT